MLMRIEQQDVTSPESAVVFVLVLFVVRVVVGRHEHHVKSDLAVLQRNRAVNFK